MDLKETVEYKDFGFNEVICPICGNKTLDNHYICPYCGWEYDEFNLLEEDYSQCNKSTLRDYRNKLLAREYQKDIESRTKY